MSFETGAGIVEAEVAGESVKIKMTDPSDPETDYTLELKDRSILVSSINTGVPHVVMVTDTIEDVEVVKMGREIRFHDMFAPAGTNVNFICPIKDNTIAIRTYERGVEDETLACGTGAVAGALIIARKMKIDPPINVLTRSGANLRIYYKEKNAGYQDIYLEGDARVIYRAELFKDAWKDNS
jgi:diaminopimelate epimerase